MAPIPSNGFLKGLHKAELFACTHCSWQNWSLHTLKFNPFFIDQHKKSRYVCYSVIYEKGVLVMQMNVSVTPELYELVQRKVQSGLYGNASEVVRDALRRMDERAIVDTAWSDLNDTLETSVASGRSPHSVGDVISRASHGNGE
jgi:antitoxin ParD1/3/4